AGARRGGPCAELALQADPLHRQLPARRQRGSRRAFHRAADIRAARPAGAGREPARRRRPHRRRRGGEARPVRLHHRRCGGGGPVWADVLGGQVPIGIVDVPSALAAVKAGKLRALAVTTSRRLASLSDVPTVAEAGVPGYESIGWFGAVAPAGTPAPIIERLN